MTAAALPLHIPSTLIETQMADAESEEASIESGSFHSGLSNEIDTDGDSALFDLDGDIYPNLMHRRMQ